MNLRLLNLLPPRPQPAIVRYGITTLMVGACFLLQLWIEAKTQTFGSYVMYPAILLAGAGFDRGSGFYATALSGALLLFTMHRNGCSVLSPEYVHRTKNDLATAASVLSLQARSQPNPDVRAALMAAVPPDSKYWGRRTINSSLSQGEREFRCGSTSKRSADSSRNP
jgi:hypothetical protein